jgi:RNA polymerase sigma-70 factor (ECF subfamily)
MEVANIYRDFRQSLFSFIRSKVNSKEDAEDILHNVFVKISSGVNGLSDDEKLVSWIYAITKNSIIDYYRLRARRNNVSIDQDIEKKLSNGEDPDPTKGLDQCVASMINLLHDDYREIIIDSEMLGIKQKDLAEKYGLAYSSLRSRVQRGRERLKQLFYNCCHIQTDKLGQIMEVSSNSNCGPCDPCGNSSVN